MMNITYFTVHDVVSMVELSEWDRVDICLESTNDHDFDSAEDNGDEDFGGFYLLHYSIFHWSFLKIELSL